MKEYVAQYFKDPGAFMENTKGGGVFEMNRMFVGERIDEEQLKRARIPPASRRWLRRS